MVGRHREKLKLMNMRFSHTSALILTVAAFIFATHTYSDVSAAITNTKDSAEFNLKNWEGDVAPSAAYGSVTDWSIDGSGNYQAVMTNVGGAIGGNGLASGATGWTVEFRMKMDPNNLPTGQVIEWQFGDNTTNPGHWSLGSVDASGGVYQIWDRSAGGDLVFAGSDITEFVTIRVATEGGPGDVRWCADGFDLGTHPGATADLNRQWLGDMGSLVSDGTVIMDYFRMDTTGAYAPL